jgi:Cu(I)/Ag(I) efflux system membrane fusion protein
MKKYFKSLARTPRKILTILIPLTLFLFGWWFGLPAEKKSMAMDDAASDTVWTCSMHPQIRQPDPGLCPICSMDLIPLDGGESGGLREVSISPEASALLDIRVSPVVALDESQINEIAVFGRISHDERLISAITARIAGRIDKLFVDFTGIMVSDNEELAELYSPEIYLAQKELIEARNAMDSGPPAVRNTRRTLYEASLRKLQLLEISPQDIAAIQTADAPSDHITIRSPHAGQVLEKNVQLGSYVKTGDVLFTIVDHSRVWLNLEVYESELVFMREDLPVTFTIEALPGKTFTGKIAYIDHLIDAQRRIARVRVDVPNPENRIKPGMFASAHILAPALPPGMENDKLVTVPESAVLRTGDRAVVYVRTADQEPTFEGRVILLGPLLGSRYIVMEGLAADETVVTQGAFKLDSELQLKAKPSMMNPTAGLEEKSAISAPEDLSGQWQPILRSLGRMENGDVSVEIETMQMVVEKITTDTFQPELKALWNEFSNRLLVDLARAKAKDPATAKSIVSNSIEQAARYLGLPSTGKMTKATDPVITARLGKIIQLYLPIAKALAADDPAATATAAAKLAQSAELPAIQKSAEAIAGATELKPQRAAFETLSNALIAQVRANGLDGVGNAYVIHCPMVGNNKGADWLSSVPQVLNPYYGDSMLDCGSVTDTLSLDPEN